MWTLLKSIPAWFQTMNRLCRFSDNPFPKERKNTKILAAIFLPLHNQIMGVAWGRSLWSDAQVGICSWAIFFLICSFSSKTQNARVTDDAVAGTTSAGWQRVLPREADLNLKTHWGEETVWLHLVRVVSWVYTWVREKLPLFMSAGLARYWQRYGSRHFTRDTIRRNYEHGQMRKVFGNYNCFYVQYITTYTAVFPHIFFPPGQAVPHLPQNTCRGAAHWSSP